MYLLTTSKDRSCKGRVPVREPSLPQLSSPCRTGQQTAHQDADPRAEGLFGDTKEQSTKSNFLPNCRAQSEDDGCQDTIWKPNSTDLVMTGQVEHQHEQSEPNQTNERA